MAELPAGKLPHALLAKLLAQYVRPDPRVLVGPGVGRDAAVLQFGDRYLIAKSDPVTFAADEIGWYAVHVNANDVACCGGVPQWFLATLLLPEHGTTPQLVEAIFRQIAAACAALRVSLCGGHTEVTGRVDRPIVVGQMLAEVARDELLPPGGARPGDRILFTKALAIEGTALLAREHGDELGGVLAPDELQRCRRLLHEPGISILPEARIALAAGGVRALHDPTEGGLATGLRELAEAAHVGCVIEEDRVPVLPECARLCQHYGLDPLGLIASGSLLIVSAPESAARILAALQAERIPAVDVGAVVTADEGCRLRARDGRLRPLPQFDRDEYTRVAAPPATS